MKYEIDLPELVLDGVRYEPTGEYRFPVNSEPYLSNRGDVETKWPQGHRIILRPVWTWPEWLSGWGIAMDEGGDLYWYENEPLKQRCVWLQDEGESITITSLVAAHQGFTQPTISDWMKPIINPNWKPPCSTNS